MSLSNNAIALRLAIRHWDRDGAIDTEEYQILQHLMLGLRYSAEMRALIEGLAGGVVAHCAALARPLAEEGSHG